MKTEKVTRQFSILFLDDGNYGVLDTAADNARVGYSHQCPPLYKKQVWQNYYAARIFCQALQIKQKARL